TVIPPMAHKEQVGLGSVGALPIFNTTDSPEAAAAWVHHLTKPHFIEDVCSTFTYYSPREEMTGQHEDYPPIAEYEHYVELVNPEIIQPQAREIIDTIKPAIQEVLLQSLHPQEALDTKESDVNDLLSRGS